MELIFILAALTAFVGVLFVVWAVWTVLGLLGRAAGAVLGALTGEGRHEAPRLRGVPMARCSRPSCLAANPVEANFCRRCGQGMAARRLV